MKEDFPSIWPEAFAELLGLLKATQDVNMQKLYMSKNYDSSFNIGFIVKVFLVLEEELIER